MVPDQGTIWSGTMVPDQGSKYQEIHPAMIDECMMMDLWMDKLDGWQAECLPIFPDLLLRIGE